MSKLYGDHNVVAKNRSAFLHSVLIDPTSLEILGPSHTNRIALVNSSDSSRAFFESPQKLDVEFNGYNDGCDGIFSFEGTGKPLGILTADCIPLLIWNFKERIYGILHVSLVNSINGLINTLGSMFSKLDIPTDSTFAYIGPCLTKYNYNLLRSGVWSRIQNQAIQIDPNFEKYTTKSADNKSLFFDLPLYTTDQLISNNFTRSNILASDICVADSKSQYFSNQKAKYDGHSTGRFLSTIEMIHND